MVVILYRDLLSFFNLPNIIHSFFRSLVSSHEKVGDLGGGWEFSTASSVSEKNKVSKFTLARYCLFWAQKVQKDNRVWGSTKVTFWTQLPAAVLLIYLTLWENHSHVLPSNILFSAKCHKFGGTHFVILAISLHKEEGKEEVQTCELQGELTTFAWHFAWQSAHFCFTNDCVKSWLMSQASMQDDTMLK